MKYPDHQCAYGPRCRDHIEVDKVKCGQPIEDQRGLCRRCYGMVRHAVEAMGSDYDALSAAVGDHAVTGQTRVAGTREPPMPLNGTILALRSTLSEWAEAALWMVAEPLGIDVRERHKAKGWPVKDGPVIEQARRILPPNLKLLLDAESQPVTSWYAGGFMVKDMDGIDVAMKIADIHADVNRVLGQTNPRLRLSLPCPAVDCGARTLGVDNGSTDVTCTTCGGRWPQDQYDWLARLFIEDENEKDAEMLKYLLAEAKWWCDVLAWCVAERDHRLFQLGRVSRLTAADLEGIDALAVVELIGEILGTKNGPETR